MLTNDCRSSKVKPYIELISSLLRLFEQSASRASSDKSNGPYEFIIAFKVISSSPFSTGIS